MISLLVCALISQLGNDIGFEVAQEEFVYESGRGGIFYLERVLPKLYADAIRNLGSSEYKCREFAEEFLENDIHNPIIKRAIIWGRFRDIYDANIKHVCNRLFYKYYCCYGCEGLGICGLCHGKGNYPEGDGSYTRCSECLRYKKGTWISYNPTRCRLCGGTGLGKKYWIPQETP